MTSNRTLRNVVEDALNQVYTGRRAKDRPDLILAGLHERQVLVELKRPDHTISRDDITQAQRYRDQLAPYLPMIEIPIMVIGGRADPLIRETDYRDVRIRSFFQVVDQARRRLDWLISNLAPAGDTA